jgi:hypothetical protein
MESKGESRYLLCIHDQMNHHCVHLNPALCFQLESLTLGGPEPLPELCGLL